MKNKTILLSLFLALSVSRLCAQNFCDDTSCPQQSANCVGFLPCVINGATIIPTASLDAYNYQVTTLISNSSGPSTFGENCNGSVSYYRWTVTGGHKIGETSSPTSVAVYETPTNNIDIVWTLTTTPGKIECIRIISSGGYNPAICSEKVYAPRIICPCLNRPVPVLDAPSCKPCDKVCKGYVEILNGLLIVDKRELDRVKVDIFDLVTGNPVGVQQEFTSQRTNLQISANATLTNIPAGSYTVRVSKENEDLLQEVRFIR
jgi:hypothetical protein